MSGVQRPMRASIQTLTVSHCFKSDSKKLECPADCFDRDQFGPAMNENRIRWGAIVFFRWHLSLGENLYNRGVMNAVLIAEAIRAAQGLTGKKQVTGEDVRRGLETLSISDARWTELGLPNFAAPIHLSCADHNGHNGIYLVEWDGNKWSKASGWIEPIRDKVMPLIESAAANYV
jgi:hypothetical protein